MLEVGDMFYLLLGWVYDGVVVGFGCVIGLVGFCVVMVEGLVVELLFCLLDEVDDSGKFYVDLC